MNLLEDLDKELSMKHLNDFEKVRYIYLRTCGLFSFDSRYSFTSLFSDDRLYSEIINRKIDITNVENFLVVCHSYSREVLLEAIRSLTSASVLLQSGGHSYVEYIERPGVIWEMDATFGDFARAKIGVQTTGFRGYFPSYKERLSETDQLLGYEYKTKRDYLNLIDLTSDEAMFKSINLLLADSKCSGEFSDALHFVRWLLLGLNYPFSDSTYVNDNYDFYHVLVSGDRNHYCCLSKADNHYSFEHFPKDHCLRLTKGLKSHDNVIF